MGIKRAGVVHHQRLARLRVPHNGHVGGLDGKPVIDYTSAKVRLFSVLIKEWLSS
jgi:hypothetical protein